MISIKQTQEENKTKIKQKGILVQKSKLGQITPFGYILRGCGLSQKVN